MNSQCSIALLESALAGNMPAEREESLHRHLEECETCSAALERMAGGADWCREAATLLIGDELDDAVPSREESSNVDFTVEHLEPSDEPNVLGRLGGYDVLEIIGRGGMGVVLKGFDRELKRCVAIKVLAPHLSHSSLAKKRFVREAQAAAAVVHPNVLAIHQVQPNGRLPFLVMPLVAGESLAERLVVQGRLDLKETLRIGMQAAAGLAAAHEQGLVHRDVKPANILLEKGVERAVLTDFGLARAADDVSMTRWGIIAGTPQYMSPEQAQGEPLDGRSDLFGLGCVLYEMATGVSPFRADSTVATLRRLIDDPPPAMASLNPELPPWFIGIVDRLLEKDPAKRFGSAKEVSELLEGCLAHLQQPTSVPLPAAIPKPAIHAGSRRRNIFIKGAITMIGIFGFVLLGMFAIQATDPPEIAGQWSGEEWGQVVLTQTAAGEYTGSYSDTVGKEPGKIELKWSRIERRFNGKWSEGEDRFGELSIRLADQEIRGALTTDLKSKINPATPRLTDFAWKRGEKSKIGNEIAAVDPAKNPNSLQGQWKVAKVEMDENSPWFKNDKTLFLPEFMTFFIFDEGNPDKRVLNTLTIDGFSRSPNPHKKEKCTYRIDPKASPKTIEIFDPRNSWMEAEKPVVVGIYEVQGDTMKLSWTMCEPSKENPQYPKSFSATPNTLAVIYLERYAPTRDEKAVYGDWIIVSTMGKNTSLRGELQGKVCSFQTPAIEFSDNHSNSMFNGQFELIWTADPKEIRITSFLQESAQREIEKVKLNGIYKLDGNRLTIAYRTDKPTPAKFESDPDSDVTLLELQRLEPKPSATIRSNPTIGPLEQKTAEQPSGISSPSQTALPYKRDLNKKWSLTRKEAIRYALSNSKVMHSIGVQVIALPESSTSAGTASGSDKPTQPVADNEKGVQIARLNTDISAVDFEAGVRNLVLDVESAYWELYFAHRNLDAKLTCRDLALETWRKVHARQNGDTKEGTAAEEAQAREQYFNIRSSCEQALSALYTAENKLRYILGVEPTDDRLIRPSDEPTTAKVSFDETEIRGEALRRNIEIRRQRWRVKQRESEVAAAKDFANSVDDQKAKEGLRNAELAATKERAKLQEAELELSHQMATAVRELEANFALAQTNFNRRKTAESNVDAVKKAYENGTVKLDVLLQAQRERATAECDYYRAVVNYVKSIATVHYRKGSLLEYAGVCLKDEPKSDKVERSEKETPSKDVNNNLRTPEIDLSLAEATGKLEAAKKALEAKQFEIKTVEEQKRLLELKKAAYNSAAGKLSHRVPFELGATNLRGGDRITIEEVNGTADEIKPGNMYEVKGTYRLVSRDSALLAAYVTVDAKDSRVNAVGDLSTQTTTVKRGEGKFTLLFYMWSDGKPHLSYYPENGGEVLGGVYFGTGESVLRKGWWENSQNHEAEPKSKTKNAIPAGFKAILGQWEVVSVEGSGGRFMSLSDQSKPGDRLEIAHVETPNGRLWLSEDIRRGWTRDDSLCLYLDADPSRLTYKARNGKGSHFNDTNDPPDFGVYRIEGDELTILAGDPSDFSVKQGSAMTPTEFRGENGATSPGPSAAWTWKFTIPNYAPGFRLEEGKKQILVKLRRVTASGQAASPTFNPVAEFKAMQGAWKVVRVEKGKDSQLPDARLVLLDGRACDILGMEWSDHSKTAYSIDPTKSPKTIDLRTFNSVGEGGELDLLGIYEFDGKHLKICLTRYLRALNNDQRPKTFTIDPNSADALYVLEREEPSADFKLLQGYWDTIAHLEDGKPISDLPRRNSKLFFTERHEIIKWHGPELTIPCGGSYLLDTTKTPPRITMFVSEITKTNFGPYLPRFASLIGIYKIENDRLTIAYRHGNASASAPDKFESTPGVTLLELKRGEPMQLDVINKPDAKEPDEKTEQPKPAADAALTPEAQPTPDKQPLQNNP